MFGTGLEVTTCVGARPRDRRKALGVTAIFRGELSGSLSCGEEGAMDLLRDEL